ncbi:TIGR00270 family protein [Infirmifilum lucidum]|uniref:TIGR00270 family protein n=1 Tax=Infirmifilum lucidum TaxID=2776706 RepID=A0A7L9FJW6_9CREN|nr:multiprotein bridging factor aMBF1 [Infirmifilum lucidum]QOJ79662.1 TIGR00270 family protein [Infirmifilum lucidum]
MAKCELCGAEIRGVAYRIVLDGAEMIVCSRCAKGRTVLGTVRLSTTPSGQPTKQKLSPRLSREDVEEVIVEGYGEIIRQAREKMGLTRELLALMVGEKESTLRRIEAGQLEPTIELARKLEKILKVKLIEQYVVGGSVYSADGDSSGYDLTLGDVAEFRD